MSVDYGIAYDNLLNAANTKLTRPSKDGFRMEGHLSSAKLEKIYLPADGLVIADTLLSSVQLKQRQGIRTETYAQEFFGQVSAISPQADQKSRTFQIEVTIPNPKGLLKSGMVATLDVGGAKLRSPALVVPIEAVVSAVKDAQTISKLSFHDAMRTGLQRVLCAPGFLFLQEPAGSSPRAVTMAATNPST